MSISIALGPVGWRYAQRSSGRKLHLVRQFGDGSVEPRALCGVRPDSRGHWRMTINVPLAHACRTCCRIYDREATR